ncbi:transcriptional regulator [Pilimelia terevasa]|uniref:Transcriptional regulator n=1 Tax=Pilimelia terevasa TaxID=53372 RepID=A0A8J3FKQ4_9ACTN|nr:Scr1 family TA system antitoxin-like transcriptional regulator [Pilimelia terevasa]GGK34430.1 transcriptional regulator [Pilimelia terevasa]
MATSESSAVADARRGLGARLRQIRRSAGLTGRALADLCGIHRTRLSRLEHGIQQPTEQNVRDWCTHCGTPETIPELLATLRDVDSAYVEFRTRVRAGLKHLGGRGSMDLYRRTQVFRIFEIACLPGPFQTDAYIRALMSYWRVFFDTPDDIAETIAYKRDRAGHALAPTKRVISIIGEEALHVRFLSPDGHEEQLTHLLAMMRMPNVAFGILPLANVRRGVSEGFWIHDDALVLQETATAKIKVTRPEEVALYVKLFGDFRDQAVWGREARAIVARTISEV